MRGDIDLDKLEPHPLCKRMNDIRPLSRIGRDVHREGAAEETALRMSLAAFGPRHRVVIDADTGQVLDGWNTLQAWRKARDAKLPGDVMEPLDPHSKCASLLMTRLKHSS
jgi:hypothetical protein